MKMTPVLLHNLQAQPISPATSEDVAPVAREATLQTLLTAIQGLPRPSTRIHRITISLASALTNSPVSFGTLTHVHTFVVVDLTGAAVPTLRMNGTGETAFPLVKGEVRDILDATTLHVSCAAGGGSLVLELQGR